MAKDWVLKILFLIYPLLLSVFNWHIRRYLPQGIYRKQFLREQRYVNKLLYLFVPVLVFHFELLLLNADYAFHAINSSVIGVLITLQSYLFLVGIISFIQFFGMLRKFKEQVNSDRQ